MNKWRNHIGSTFKRLSLDNRYVIPKKYLNKKSELIIELLVEPYNVDIYEDDLKKELQHNNEYRNYYIFSIDPIDSEFIEIS
jgi:hypothetical protein